MLNALLNLFSNDPTSEWAECHCILLSLNLQTASLNTVAIGDSWEKLRAFGRPDNRNPVKKNRFVYYPLGMEAAISDGVIEELRFIINSSEEMLEFHKEDAKFFPAEFTLTTKTGGYLAINKRTSVADVERIFGNAIEEDYDEGCVNLIYHHGKLMLDFEFGGNSLLERFTIAPWD